MRTKKKRKIYFEYIKRKDQRQKNTDNSISYIATYAQVPIKDPGSIKPEIPIPTT